MPLAASGWRCRRSASVRARANRPRSAPSAQLDGAFPGGRVQALRLPIQGRVGPGGSFAFGTSCAVVSFNRFQMSSVAASARPGCRCARSDRRSSSKGPAGSVRTAAQFSSPALDGTLGKSPLHVAAASGQMLGQNFVFNRFGAAARQAGIADRVRRRPPDRHLRARRLRRRLHAGARRPSATSRCCSAMAPAAGATATASWRWTAR